MRKLRFVFIMIALAASCTTFLLQGMAQDDPRPPEMGGGDVRPSYESFRMDKPGELGEPSPSGDLGFSIPLLVVPGRHGHEFPIAIHYSSHIGQRQFASWVGLGWSLDLGAVERTVVGRADDQPEGLYSPYSLNDDASLNRAELRGRLAYNHSQLPHDEWGFIKRDQADSYRLTVDGASEEILPFPDSTEGEVNVDDLTFQNYPIATFLPLQYKPWQIEANWNEGHQYLSQFRMRKEDGSLYLFQTVDGTDVSGTGEYFTPQSFWFPYRWGLSSIQYPDGATTSIEYTQYNGSSGRYQRFEPQLLDRDFEEEEYNFFGINNYGLEYGYAGYDYSSPDSLMTDTHVLRFYVTHPATDSTDRNQRLDSLVLYDKATHSRLKTVVFSYATQPSSNNWNTWILNTRLKDNQLTLVGLTVRADNTPSPEVYSFQYMQNPTISLSEFNIIGNQPDAYHYPGYNKESPWDLTTPVWATAWRLFSMTLPTGGTVFYTYGRLPGVKYDPEGNEEDHSDHGDSWNESSEPACRIVSKQVIDPFGSTLTWNYTYGETVFDPPGKPTVQLFIPKGYRARDFHYGYGQYYGYYDDPAMYYKFFRGCQVGHRWIQVQNPDGSTCKSWYTTSIQGSAVVDPQESHPDLIDQDPLTDQWYNTNDTTIWSRAGERGLIWKVETNADTTIYEYSFPILAFFYDVYTYYHRLSPTGWRHYIQQTSIWPRLDRATTTRDGVTSITEYQYNPTCREVNPPNVWDNGLVNRIKEYSPLTSRTTDFKYACEVFADMYNVESCHMWSQLYSTKVSKDSRDQSEDITTWGKYGDHWLPRKQWVWAGAPGATQAPADTTQGMLGIATNTYESPYANLLQKTDANGFTANYYYSSDTLQPFTNTANGLAAGYVTGVIPPQPAGVPSPLQYSYKYDQYGKIREIVKENGDATKLTYDRLGRLASTLGPGGQKLSDFSYNLVQSPASITSQLYRTDTNLVKSTTYLDGLGYAIQQQVQRGSGDITTATTFGLNRQVERVYKTYEDTLAVPHTYDTYFDPHALTYAQAGDTAVGDKPYALNEYYADGTGRLRHSHAPGYKFQNEDGAHYTSLTYSYGIDGRASDPNSTIHAGTWSAVGGSLYGVLADGATYNDANYAKAVSAFDTLTVGIAAFTGTVDSSLYYEITIRGKSSHGYYNTGYSMVGPGVESSLGGGVTPMLCEQGPMVCVQLLEGGVERGTQQFYSTDLYYPTFTEHSFTVPAWAVTNPANLSVRLVSNGHFEGGDDWLDVSWLRVTLGMGRLAKTTTTDENGTKRQQLTDIFGNTITSTVDSAGLNLSTRCYYDASGRVVSSINPMGQTSVFTYNRRGLLMNKTAPDVGKVQYRYDKSGNLRFQQDSVQILGGRYSYFKYDRLNRLVEVGEVSGMFTMADSTTTGTPSSDAPTSGTMHQKKIYDTNISGDASARKLLGRVSCEVTDNNGVRDSVFYSYDEYARVEWQLLKLSGLTSKKILYSYDRQGNPTQVSYIDNGLATNNTYFFYEYDAAGRLIKEYSGQNSNGTGKVQDALYTYLANGQVKRLQLGIAQGVDYRYNERDWLKQINQQNLNTSQDPGHDGPGGSGVAYVDKFGMVIGYNNITDIGSAQATPAQWNGNISWVMYNMSGVNYTGTGGTTSLVGYTFNYDKANRLRGADFGYYTTSWLSTKAYDDSVAAYDANGNIQSVRRYGANGGMMDYLTYNYQTGKNRLLYITDTVATSRFTVDIDNQSSGNYLYDVNGSLKKDVQGQIDTIKYDYRGLPLEIKKAGTSTYYRYNAGGQRVFKQTGTGVSTYYIADISGRTLAVVKSSTGNPVFNLWGNDHIGQLQVVYGAGGNGIVQGLETPLVTQPRSDTRYYFLKDHLGSVRVTVDVSGNVTSYDDFYPFGMTMDGRSGNIGSGDARYKYTTKERDAESGYDYFGARYYDARIGRWLSPDADMRWVVGWGPYSYVKDSPLLRIDPDGNSDIKYYLASQLLILYSSDGKELGRWRAGNNADSHSKGGLKSSHLPYGKYFFKDKTKPTLHYNDDDTENGQFGPNGIFELKDFVDSKGIPHTQVGVHSGRLNKGRPFPGRQSWEYWTHGCIRTTDAAMEKIRDTAGGNDPLKTLEVMKERVDDSRVPADPGPGIIIPPPPPIDPVVAALGH
jgi:RHS repeat-associated protein